MEQLIKALKEIDAVAIKADTRASHDREPEHGLLLAVREMQSIACAALSSLNVVKAITEK